MTGRIISLEEFTNEQLRQIPGATGMLSALLRDIGLAGKRISAAVNRAGLANILGAVNKRNVHNEEVQRLDVYAQQLFRDALNQGHSCAGIASEELEGIEVFNNAINNRSRYVVAFDPLDGSSNIETNISIGSIFGVYKRISQPGLPCTIDDFLQPGTAQVAAGYIMYGSSTMLVYATRRGAQGFTLDPHIGEFCLSHPTIHCPADAGCYSVNHAYLRQYNQPVQDFIRHCQHTDGSTERYTGSMVADMHRTLLKGGIFLYPGTSKKPTGKLRLLYECNPYAFLMEVAGGKAMHDHGRILEVMPQSLHQTSPLYIGSVAAVNRLAARL